MFSHNSSCIQPVQLPLKLYRKQKVYLWCDLWEANLLPSNWAYLNLVSSSWLCILVLQSQLLTSSDIRAWIWLACRDHVKINYQIWGLLLRQRRYELKIHLEASSLKKNTHVWIVMFLVCLSWDLGYNFFYIFAIWLIFYWT